MHKVVPGQDAEFRRTVHWNDIAPRDGDNGAGLKRADVPEEISSCPDSPTVRRMLAGDESCAVKGSRHVLRESHHVRPDPFYGLVLIRAAVISLNV